MALMLKANTAVDVLIGPFVDDTDGKTVETGLTISQADVLLSKNGQALTQKNDATAASHDSGGYYNCELDATDTNTEGQLVLVVNESGALPVRHEFNILSEAAWDSLFAAKDTGYMDVNVKAISEDTTAADNAELAFDGTGYGFTGCTMPTVTTLTGHTAQTGDNYARLGAPAGASIAADIAENQADLNTVIADTNELQTDWTNGGRLDLIIDELTSQGDTNEGKLDTIITDTNELQTDWTNGGRLDLIVDAILADTNELQTDWTNGGRLDLIIDELTSQGDTNEGKIDTIDGIVDDILVDTAVIGAAGAGLTAIPWNASWDAEVESECTDALNTYDPPTKGEMDAGFAALNDVSTAEVNAEVVDALNTDTYAEPGDEAPGATVSLATKISYLYKFMRNKIETTASKIHIYNDAGANKDQTSNISDDGTTFTRGEFGIGDP